MIDLPKKENDKGEKRVKKKIERWEKDLHDKI